MSCAAGQAETVREVTQADRPLGHQLDDIQSAEQSLAAEALRLRRLLARRGGSFQPG
jgi:hypothetical protein